MTTFYIEQFGCRATQADGAAIERQLLDRGCALAPSANEAEIVVINTCTVTAAADTQARDAIRKLHSANPATKIIVTGCYAQRAPHELAQLPGVTHVVGNSHKPQISSLIAPADNSIVSVAHLLAPGNPEFLIGDIFHTEFLAAPVLGGEGNHTRPTVKIQDGCNNRCSFCVIPFVRGKSRSMPRAQVLREIQKLADSGFQEVVLSGINIATWGQDFTPREDFSDLLRAILDETSIGHLRVSSIEPLDVTQDLIQLFASTSRLAPHFHMPLQSGSDRILAAMHRWYRTAHYSRRLELIQEFLPHAAVGADVITGFPGETEKDHSTTLQFIEQRPFTYLHVFSYSSRPGTKAAALSGHLRAAEIKRRARELRSLSDAKSAAFRKLHLGRQLRVLTLHADEEDQAAGITPALSPNYLRVSVSGNFPANQWLNVQIRSGLDSKLLANVQDAMDSARSVPAFSS